MNRAVPDLVPRAVTPERKKSFFYGLWTYSFNILRNRTFWPLNAGAGMAAPPVNSISSSTKLIIDQSVALSLSAAWACTWRYANTIGTLPLMLMRTGPQNTATVAGDLELYTLLHDQPHAKMSASAFWQSVVVSMFLWGNAYAVKERIGKRITGLRLLRPEYVTPYLTANEQLRFDYSPGLTDTEDYSADEVFHLFHRSIDGIVGTSQLQYGANSMGLALSADNASALSYRTGLRASGFIKVNTWLKPEQREMYRQSVMGFYGPGDATDTAKQGGVMVIENAADFQPITMKPIDVELLASRKFSVEDVCRFFDCPPVLVGHAAEGQTMWGSGISEIILGWFKLGLAPILRRIEQEIWRQLLTPVERLTLFAEFNLDALLRADSEKRASFYATMCQNGLYTRNEARARENLPPLEGGDVLTVQSNLVPLEKLGEEPEPAPEPEPEDKPGDNADPVDDGSKQVQE